MLWYRELAAVAFLFVLCSLYYVIPLLVLLTPVGALLGCAWCLQLLLLLVLLAVVPTWGWRSFRRGWLMGCVLEYFAFRWLDAKEVREQRRLEGKDDSQQPYDASRRFLAVWMPHGIVPLGPLCGGAFIEQRWPELYGRFAVAPSVLRLPLLRQLLGFFDIASADYLDMKAGMRRRNMSLTPGGIAEMFLTDRETERIFLRERKGFCKLALTTGADLSLIYLYGATQLFDSIKPSHGQT